MSLGESIGHHVEQTTSSRLPSSVLVQINTIDELLVPVKKDIVGGREYL